jgi:peptidyl-prolyl cis-trans isomerase A (cyclophilin A)
VKETRPTLMPFVLAAALGVALGSVSQALAQAPAAKEAPKAAAKEAPKAAAPATPKAPSAEAMKALKDPKSAEMTKEAPATFKVKFETSKGNFTVMVHRDWAPHGADRFYNLVRMGYYNDVRFFRVISGFMAQFGISGDPALNAVWKDASIPDDPVTQSNTRGRITFATRGPNTRTTQLFINFGNNAALDRQGFAPFGEVTEGMEVVDGLYAGYGEGAPRGKGPDQMKTQGEGNAYLKASFPKLDYIKHASIVE